LTTWKIDLRGYDSEISHLKELAPCCDCRLVAAPDGQYCLSGSAFDQVTSAEEMLSRAEQTLALLNGVARLERAEHRPVWLGEYVYNEEWQRFCTGKPQVAGPLGGSFEFSPTGYHSSDAPIAKDSKYKRRRRMVGSRRFCPRLPTRLPGRTFALR
jgi:hypothetical protein